MVEYQKEVEIAKWLMSRGYSEFDFSDGLWMEDTVLDHSWRDIIELMHDYAAAQAEAHPDTVQRAQPATEARCGNCRAMQAGTCRGGKCDNWGQYVGQQA